jgi:hypothetical protein
VLSHQDKRIRIAEGIGSFGWANTYCSFEQGFIDINSGLNGVA